MRHPGSSPRRATAAPGRVRAMAGGVRGGGWPLCLEEAGGPNRGPPRRSMRAVAPVAAPPPRARPRLYPPVIVADLARAPDGFPTAVRARVVVVMNAAATDGVTVPLAWEDEIDWKAYAVFLRLHAIDHLNQARKVLAALAGC